MSVLVHLEFFHNICYSCHVLLMLRSKLVTGRCSYILYSPIGNGHGAEVPVLKISGLCRI